MLEVECHDVQGYEDMHRRFYAAVEKRVQGCKKGDPNLAPHLHKQLHFLSGSDLLSDNAPSVGAHDVCLLLSSLPDRFKRHGVRAGTIFIDTFAETHRL